MTWFFGRTGRPSPELLAAYLDGEFEGRDDLVNLRRRLEDWLEANPQAQEQAAGQRLLRRLWLETTPAEPDRAAWNSVLLDLEHASKDKPPAPAPAAHAAGWSRFVLGLSTASAACLGIFFLWPLLSALLAPAPARTIDRTALFEDDALFPVAAAHEIEVLRVEGQDTGTLVVGELPWQGPMDLARPGDVTLTSVQPAARDNMVPAIHVRGGRSPMFIWAKADPDE